MLEAHAAAKEEEKLKSLATSPIKLSAPLTPRSMKMDRGYPLLKETPEEIELKNKKDLEQLEEDKKKEKTKEKRMKRRLIDYLVKWIK